MAQIPWVLLSVIELPFISDCSRLRDVDTERQTVFGTADGKKSNICTKIIDVEIRCKNVTLPLGIYKKNYTNFNFISMLDNATTFSISFSDNMQF